MFNQGSEKRTLGLIIAGVLAGLCLSQIWPHEPALAEATTDRSEFFTTVTCPTLFGAPDAVFVFDFVTGRLYGWALNQQGNKVTHFYGRNVAGDFQLDPNMKPHYTIVCGRAASVRARGVQWANSVLYVTEHTSGKVACYRFPYQGIAQKPLTPITLPRPFAMLPFRARLKE